MWPFWENNTESHVSRMITVILGTFCLQSRDLIHRESLEVARDNSFNSFASPSLVFPTPLILTI